ncbi:MAG: hypothetical protein DHS20C17_20450 [Cyclobacteriaceae bacterium]|nr:MAG: hypothetical protein DHS20C17_20450 [Cyclobacteriaceae bacterium]
MLNGFVTVAQQTTLIHLDKPYYVAGETVHYKIYLPSSLVVKAALLKVVIYNSKSDQVHSSYLEKEGEKHAYGYYLIPFEADPDLYTLTVSSFDIDSNRKIILGQVELPVYSDTSKETHQISDSTGANYRSAPVAPDLAPDLDITIHMPNAPVEPREPISALVEIKDRQGNPVEADISISITDVDLIGRSGTMPYFSLSEYPLQNHQNVYLSQQIPVSGALDNKQEGVLLTFYVPSLNKLFYTRSDSGGSFQLLMSPYYGDQMMQYIGGFTGHKTIQLSPNDMVFDEKNLVYTTDILNYLSTSAKRKLVYQLYNTLEMTMQFSIPNLAETLKPDRRIKATDYPFENLIDFCNEISTPLKFVTEKSAGSSFKMFNPESRNFYFGSPLFIVDQQLTRDVDYLSSLEFQKLDSISLYYSNQNLSNYFGFAGFSGVVVITSKSGNLKVPRDLLTQQFNIGGLQPEMVEDKPHRPPQVPLFQPRLLWEPSLNTNQQGRAAFSFTQSDDISVYQIEVVAQSAAGLRGYRKLEYQSHRTF